MKPDLSNLTPEEKRALVARMLKQKLEVCKTAFIIQGLVLHVKMHNTPVGNMRSTVRFFRKIDPELLRTRMQRVLDRHPALRTTYAPAPNHELEFEGKILAIRFDAMKLWELNLEAQIEQRVHAQHTLEMRIEDATGWTAEELRERLLADALQSYSLGHLPVCRLRLYQCEHYDVMQFDVHHCAADLWSLELIMAELEQPPEGPAPPPFAEFCTWQHAWFATPKAEEMRQWWTRELDGCPELTFPFSEDDDPSDFVRFQLDAELMAKARGICRSHRITMFNLVLSTLQVSLGLSLGLDDFALGGAVANRPNQRFEQTVGFFAQLVLYRRNLAEVTTWEELWSKNRTTIGEVLQRQFLPVTTTQPTPRTDVWIMFQQYQKARWYEEELPNADDLGLRSGGVVDSPLGPWELLYVELPVMSSPVMFEIIEQKDSMQGLFRYRLPCMSRAQAEFYTRDFQARLAASLEDPQSLIAAQNAKSSIPDRQHQQ